MTSSEALTIYKNPEIFRLLAFADHYQLIVEKVTAYSAMIDNAYTDKDTLMNLQDRVKYSEMVSETENRIVKLESLKNELISDKYIQIFSKKPKSGPKANHIVNWVIFELSEIIKNISIEDKEGHWVRVISILNQDTFKDFRLKDSNTLLNADLRSSYDPIRNRALKWKSECKKDKLNPSILNAISSNKACVVGSRK